MCAGKLPFMELSERVKVACARAQELGRAKDRADFARKSGITPQAYYAIESGKTLSLKSTTATAMARLTGIRAEWLTDGRGARSASPHETEHAYPQPSPIRVWGEGDDLPEGSYVVLPRLPAGTEGEELRGGGEMESQAFRSDYAAAMGWTPETHAMLESHDDGMAPTIQRGASVVVGLGDVEVQSGRIYALWMDERIVLRRLFKLPGGGIRITADNTANPTYASLDVPPEHLNVIGRAVWTSSVL